MRKILFLLALLLLPFSAQAASVKIEEVTSPKGIKAWLVHDDKLPLVALNFAFRGGVEQDPADKQGLAELTTNLLTEGAGAYDAATFQQQLADNSIVMDFGAARDSLTGSAKFLTSKREKAVELLHAALTAPHFDAESIARARQQQLTAIKMSLGNPSWQARYALFSQIFGTHPYGYRHLGSVSSVNAIKRDDITQFAQAHFARDNLVVAAAGAITAQELGALLDAIFSDLPAKAQNKPVSDVIWPASTAFVGVQRAGTQSQILFALPAPRQKDPDYYPAEVINYVLGGGGFDSRLMKAVRDNEGLTYGINTSLAPMDHASLLVGSFATENAKAGRALDLVRDVWRKMYTDGLSADDITMAQNYLTGALPLALTSTHAIARAMVNVQLDGEGKNYFDRYPALIRKVSADDVRRVLKKYFDPAALSLVVVGDPQGITPTLKRDLTRE